MRSTIFLTLMFFSSTVLCQQDSNTQIGNDLDRTPETYDAELAQKLGADDYGMRKYVIAFLKRGPNRPEDAGEAAKLQSAHMENINRLAEQGSLVMAGPFLDDGELRGIYIFAVDSIEAAQALTATDPAIQAGSLIMELKRWYGSAALMQAGEIHSKVAKLNP